MFDFDYENNNSEEEFSNIDYRFNNNENSLDAQFDSSKNQSNYFNISNHESNSKSSGFSTNNFEDILRQSQKQSNISKKTRSTQPATQVSQVVIQSTSCKKTPLNNQINSNLVSVTEIPLPFRKIFKEYTHFNHVQSKVFQEIIYTNQSMVISAPTGSGKTGTLELAIVRLLMLDETKNFKIIYMAPLRALCNEKYNDWSQKFSQFNLNCIELTGDDENSFDDFKSIKNSNIICTTPEKWDVVTRRWSNRQSLMAEIKLFLIDEIHILGEMSRGSTIEVVVSRMKACVSSNNDNENENKLRFIGVSATIPNISDIGEWLTMDTDEPASIYKIDDIHRPVPIKKVVLTFPCPQKVSDFCFDLKLNYKLADVINKYSNDKPTLIFCSTRKSTQTAAGVLVKDRTFYFNAQNKNKLASYASQIVDPKLKEIVLRGVGIHHAGLHQNDRKLVETMFISSDLKVLLCTSTLAIGVNLPAHLVIIKSTEYYVNQKFVEYSMTQILQMIGRAGRPQFDTSATAVIMTKYNNQQKYESLVEGNHCIESHLHERLIEHINNEIVLRTVTNIETAINWLKSTFLYIRLKKNPKFYGANRFLNESDVENYLGELCDQSINSLISINLVKFNESTNLITPTSDGYLMSKYCISFETMKSFIINLSPTDITYFSIEDLLQLISMSKEFDDIAIRTNEKSALNELNNPKNEKFVRYPFSTKIKTNSMKVNILMQSELGSIPVTDFSLVQDIIRIFRFSTRISKCLMEYILNRVNDEMKNNFELCLNSILLAKSFAAKLWFDTPHIFRQFERIGPTTSQVFVDANYTTFESIQMLTLFEIQRITNKNAKFSAEILKTIKSLPKFLISLANFEYADDSAQSEIVTIEIQIKIENLQELKQGGYFSDGDQFFIIIGDENKTVLHFNKLSYGNLISNGLWSKNLLLEKSINGSLISVAIVSANFVGVDKFLDFYLFESEKFSDDEISEEHVDKGKKRKKSKNTQENPKTKKTKTNQQNKSSLDDWIEKANPTNDDDINKKFKKFEFTPSVNFTYENYKQKDLVVENQKAKQKKDDQEDLLNEDIYIISKDKPSTSSNSALNNHENTKTFRFTPSVNSVYENYEPKVFATENEQDLDYQEDLLNEDIYIISKDKPSTWSNPAVNNHENKKTFKFTPSNNSVFENYKPSSFVSKEDNDNYMSMFSEDISVLSTDKAKTSENSKIIFEFKNSLQELFENDDNEIENVTKKSPPNNISSLLNKTNESIYPTPPAYSNYSVSKLSDKYQTNKIQHKISKASTNSSIDIFCIKMANKQITDAKIDNIEKMSSITPPPSKISSLLKKVNISSYASTPLEKETNNYPTPSTSNNYSNLFPSYSPAKSANYKLEKTPIYSKLTTNSTVTNQTSNFNKRINEIDKKVKDTEVDSIKDLLTFMDHLY